MFLNNSKIKLELIYLYLLNELIKGQIFFVFLN